MPERFSYKNILYKPLLSPAIFVSYEGHPLTGRAVIGWHDNKLSNVGTTRRNSDLASRKERLIDRVFGTS